MEKYSGDVGEELAIACTEASGQGKGKWMMIWSCPFKFFSPLTRRGTPDQRPPIRTENRSKRNARRVRAPASAPLSVAPSFVCDIILDVGLFRVVDVIVASWMDTLLHGVCRGQ